MAAGSTYTPIATTTLGSTATSYTFSSIPSTYTDLVVVCSTKSTENDNIAIQFNSDTGSNYSNTYVLGNGTAASSGRNTSVTQAFVGGINSEFGTAVLSVMNYANSTTYKSVLSRANWAGFQVRGTVALWRSTSAITSMTLLCTGAAFQVGSTFTLYGIAAA